MKELTNKILDLLEEESVATRYVVEDFILANKTKSGKLILEILDDKYNLAKTKLAILNSQALPYIPDENYLSALNKILNHKNSTERLQFFIIQKIGWRGEEAEHLIPTLEKYLVKNGSLAGIASIALSEINWSNTDKLIPNLVKALNDEPDHSIRMAAARQLLKYDSVSSDVFSELVKVMKNDSDFRVRQKIAHYLGELEKKEAIPYLEEIITNDKHTLVRSVASSVLSDLQK
ncbi:MAG: HEAT repeat domain-containing protein [Asgard group archaeon]|nr:HEAT repeat domain-containing protein [Asgard group archaeon]